MTTGLARCTVRRRVYTRAAALLLTLLSALVAPTAAQVDVTVEPVMTKGPVEAPVVIVEFSDYQCPHCRNVQPLLATLLKEYDGRVRLVFKDFPLTFHPLARPAAVAARCAGLDGRYWPYHDRLFAEQPRFDRGDLVRYARDLGLDADRFASCLDERRHAAAVDADVRQARALGVTGTPTFLINGRMLVGAHPIETFREVIAEALSGREPR